VYAPEVYCKYTVHGMEGKLLLHELMPRRAIQMSEESKWVHSWDDIIDTNRLTMIRWQLSLLTDTWFYDKNCGKGSVWVSHYPKEEVPREDGWCGHWDRDWFVEMPEVKNEEY